MSDDVRTSANRDDIRRRLRAGESVKSGDYPKGYRSSFRTAMKIIGAELGAEGLSLVKTNIPRPAGRGNGRPEVAYSISSEPRPRSYYRPVPRNPPAEGTQRAEIQLRIQNGESVHPSEYASTVVVRAIRQMITQGSKLARDFEPSDNHGMSRPRSSYRLAKPGEPVLTIAETQSKSRQPLPSEPLDPALQEAARRLAQGPATSPPRAPLRLVDPSVAPELLRGSRNGSSAPPATSEGPTPAIGSMLQVRGVQLDRSGRLSLVLGDGSWLWAASLHGATRDEE